ncbi:hypothetical protein [Aureispira sp. CCB-QB1]|uniref:DUF5724 domain-containing protein n=1 Tax=Aureispira sp. CCB-QB1 TaxID=1313421 RepID=UPI000B08321E|nr:hypothetical protein [Aureispira sp. CCB-QB1]
MQIFRNIEGQLERIPQKGKSLSNIVFSWLSVEIHLSMAYKAMLKLIDATKEEDVRLILPHFSKMSVADREQATQIILPTYYPYYNNDNKKNKGVLTHFGKHCYGKTPYETFIKSIPLAKEKMLSNKELPVDLFSTSNPSKTGQGFEVEKKSVQKQFDQIEKKPYLQDKISSYFTERQI